jgi:cellulose synthase/poly-beta-1,6-N-acetylglucosamine synthase-like glycosyltransferase
MNVPDLVRSGIEACSNLFLLYSCALGIHYAMLLFFGVLETMRLVRGVPWQEARRRMQSPLTPPISLVVPAYNEGPGISATVRSLLALNYPEFEVVIVNDGSKDNTLQTLIDDFDLHPVWRPYVPRIPSRPVRGVYESIRHKNLRVVDKENFGCKADAANAGLNLARHPLVAITDGDCILDASSLLRAVRPFVRDPDRTVAVGGTIRIANGCQVVGGRIAETGMPRGLLPRIQAVEYMRSFLLSRMAWSWAGGLLIVSGAFGLFDRRTILEAGGFATDTLGEDMELVVRLHHRLSDANADYRVRFVPEPVCWTEVPSSLRVLRGQRIRWHKGLLDVLWRHRSMMGRPRYGAVGVLALPSYLLFEVLGPVIELVGLVFIPTCWALGTLNTQFVLALVLLVGSLGVLFSMLAVLLDDVAFRSYRRTPDLARLATAALLENFGYRQLTAWWRVRASWEYLIGRRRGWGTMERSGLGKS